ncbi:MAG: alpha-L-fucosidase [Terriglobia bacterium]
MKHLLAIVASVVCMVGPSAGEGLFAQSQPAQAPISPAQRIEWFRHDKFGMFIHFGPYSLLAGEWKNNRIPVGTEAEWIMERFNIPVAEYREMAHQLNPVKFNADEWVSLAKATGMKYLVVTAKHHDGFAMYHSQVTRYNIVDWTPFKRDPVQELSEACRRQGIRFCVYYSHREDWDDPDGYGNTWDYDPAKKNFDRYLEKKSKPQLRELLTNYGPLGLVWFDRGIDTPQQAEEFVKIVRTLQPLCLINGRVGNYAQDLMGDYQDMGDNGMPTGGLDETWETPQTLNGTWGYSKYDQEWKTPGVVIHKLVEIVGKGGNYLLNVGPRADGALPEPALATLRRVGAWMQENGESIYGTTVSPLPEYPWGRTTVKGSKIYLHVFSWPADDVVRVSGLKNEVKAAYLLARPAQRLSVSRDHGVVLVTVPATRVDENDTVVVLEVVGQPLVNPPLVMQSTDSPFHLDYLTAVTAGHAEKRFNRDGAFFISNFAQPDDSITWRLHVSQAGSYRLRIRYAARHEWGEAKYIVNVGPQSLSAVVTPTGENFQYQTFELGALSVAKVGEYSVRVQPAADYDHNLMYFQSLELRLIR